mgnify:CR=1 FL=1
MMVHMWWNECRDVLRNEYVHLLVHITVHTRVKGMEFMREGVEINFTSEYEGGASPVFEILIRDAMWLDLVWFNLVSHHILGGKPILEP